MDKILLDSFELNKSFIQFENNSSSDLFSGLNNSKLEQGSSSFYSSKKKQMTHQMIVLKKIR